MYIFCFFFFSHWPKFDLLVRQVLLSCRFRVVVPEEETVFEHFLNTDTKMCPTVTRMNTSSPPKVRPENPPCPEAILNNTFAFFV